MLVACGLSLRIHVSYHHCDNLSQACRLWLDACCLRLEAAWCLTLDPQIQDPGKLPALCASCAALRNILDDATYLVFTICNVRN